MSEQMHISPRYTVEYWKGIDFSTEEGWRKAIDIFENTPSPLAGEGWDGGNEYNQS